MLETHHHWLPVILAVYLPMSFVITYCIAVAYKHVEPGFPYISDTGTFPPESCVFGQLLNIGAVICGIIVYIRYRHILLLYDNKPGSDGILKLNLAAFIIGMLTNLGVSMVGNFQETSVIIVHLIGAFLAFAVGFVYCILQTILTFKMARRETELPGNTAVIRRVRVAVCVIEAILLIIFGISSLLSKKKGADNVESHYKWTTEDPGYAEHLVATISEWLIAIASVVYFSTFYTEFKHFRVKPPTVCFYDDSVLKDTEPQTAISVIR